METSNEVLLVDPGLLQQAEQICRQRLKNDSDNRAVLRSLAEVCRKQGKLEEAATAYDKLFRLDPWDQEAGYLQALFGEKEWPTAPTGLRAAPFVLLKHFLPQEFHDPLIPFLISVEEKFVHSSLTRKGGKQQYNPDFWQALDFTEKWESRERIRVRLREITPRVVPRLHVPPFKIRHVESHVRAY
jgi:tetratricopeptide (TPR) repeat protein